MRHDALVVGAIRPPTGSRPLSAIVVGWPRDDGLLDYEVALERAKVRPGQLSRNTVPPREGD